jgi:oligopeptide/dipeptide ABC transporter ATP-binding protein
MTSAGSVPVLSVSGLTTSFLTDGVWKSVVQDVSFDVAPGETVAIVGESGSGKSVTSLSIMRLLAKGSSRIDGRIMLNGKDVLSLPEKEMRQVRGNDAAMIFQEPMTSLNPIFTIGRQISEALTCHGDISKADARAETIRLLEKVRIPNAASRFEDYPHQFSGGMRQRAMIAMALVCNPQLLIADEPTTALDVTVQAQILDLMRDLQREFNSALIIITHDLGVVAELADDIMVMYAGRAVEYGPARTVFTAPEHPYTWGLLGSMPRIDRAVQDRLLPIPGNPPSLINVPSGCAFHPRCPYVARNHGRCETEIPELLPVDSRHLVRCHLPTAERKQIFNEEIRPHL